MPQDLAVLVVHRGEAPGQPQAMVRVLKRHVLAPGQAVAMANP